MKKINRLLGLAVIAALSLTTWSCQKDDLKTPQIIDLGIENNSAVAVSEPVAFKPQYSAEVAEYKWSLNGVKVSSEKEYTFTPDKAGRYTVSLSVKNGAGEDEKQISLIVCQHLGGLYIVNEGQGTGRLNYYDTNKNEFIPDVYPTYNDDKTLGITTQYGTFWNDRMYLVSKQGKRLVCLDAVTLKETGSLNDIGGDGRAFCGIDENRGVVSTSEGAFIVNLEPLSLGGILTGTEESQCGDLFVSNGHLFVVSQDKGMLVYTIGGELTLKKTVADVQGGFAQTKNGKLWAVKGNNTLLKIDPSSLSVEEVPLPEGIAILNSWGSWRPCPLRAAYQENALYFTKQDPNNQWADINAIYKYKVDDIGSLSRAFASGTTGDDNFYGTFAVDPKTDDLYVTSIKSGWGANSKDNRLIVFDGATGTENERLSYDTENFWFPSMVVFNIR